MPAPAWECEADTCRVKLRRLCIVGNFPRRIPTRELHVAFNIPYIYDFITRLCRQEADVIRNHENPYIRNTGTVKVHTESIRDVHLAAARPTPLQASKHYLSYKAWTGRITCM